MTLPRTISKIPVHLYGGTLLFCKTRKDFEKAYKYLHGSEYPEDTEEGAGLTCREHVVKDGKIFYLSGVFDQDIETVVHEAGHVANIIMKRSGINPHDDDGEAFCFLLEYVFRETNKKVFEQPKKKKVTLETQQIKDNDATVL